MLHIFTNKVKQAEWQAPYEELYIRELTKRKYPFQVTDRDDKRIKLLTAKDFLWVMHYKDLEAGEELKKTTGCRIISQSNGTAANPYVYQVHPNIEEYQMRNIIDICLVFNKRHNLAMKSLYPEPYYIETGFPVEVPRSRIKKKAKTIIIPGRISPDRQFYLSTYLLAPLLRKGYEITFAVPKKEFENSKYWTALYHTENFLRQGFKMGFYDRQDFLKKLAESEFIFLASLGDICSVSLAEGLMLGCHPIVPMFGTGLPTYDAIVQVGYTPFSRDGVAKLIKQHPTTVSWRKDLYSPKECAGKLIQGIKQYESNI